MSNDDLKKDAEEIKEKVDELAKEEDKTSELMEKFNNTQAFVIKRKVFAETIANFVYKLVPFSLVKFDDDPKNNRCIITLIYLHYGRENRQALEINADGINELNDNNIVRVALDNAKKFVEKVLENIIISG